jgi:phthalate 4,5-cis-dihydrodiol dehydrogenase
MNKVQLRMGISGLGRGFMLLLPTLAAHPDLRLVAAADPRAEARRQFEQDFSGQTFDDFEAMCESESIDVLYIASPHQFHRSQVEIAAHYKKHVLVEKPMALSLPDCQAMIEAMDDADRILMVGHSHSFDTPYLKTAEILQRGDYGAVRMILALNFTDFLYRPRRPEELDTAQGGGVIYSQAAHQVDIVRLLGGGDVARVTAETGVWDTARPTEGAYSALLSFANGTFASISYSGYAHFDTDEFNQWRGELGQSRSLGEYGMSRAALKKLGSSAEEAALKNSRTYGSGLGLADTSLKGIGHNHFGFVIVSCDTADLRPTPIGIDVYGNTSHSVVPLPNLDIPRREVIDELVTAIRKGTPAIHSGTWGMATIEVCLAILESARVGKTQLMNHQYSIN